LLRRKKDTRMRTGTKAKERHLSDKDALEVDGLVSYPKAGLAILSPSPILFPKVCPVLIPKNAFFVSVWCCKMPW